MYCGSGSGQCRRGVVVRGYEVCDGEVCKRCLLAVQGLEDLYLLSNLLVDLGQCRLLVKGRIVQLHVRGRCGLLRMKAI